MNLLKKTLNFAVCYLCLTVFSLTITAQTLAPGAPGKDAQWATAGKQGVGTSANLESKVWFTLAQGVMTEVYYPDVTTANVHLLQFVVVNPKTKKIETEQDDAMHAVETDSDSLTFTQINTAKSGEWKITKTYTIDSERNTIIIWVRFKPKNYNDKYNLYVYYDPSINNSGMHDTAWFEGGLIAQDGNIASALIAEEDLGNIDWKTKSRREVSSGFFGVNDGLTELRKNNDGSFQDYQKAENGNVVQFALFNARNGLDVPYRSDTLYLSFGKTPQEALTNAQKSKAKGYNNCLREYLKGWSDYVKTLPKVEPKYQAQFNMAAMILKAHEDKTKRGANIASLTVPWGGGDNANENTVGGYHLVWSRDLYQVATAYMALGDTAAANRALDFVFNVQQKEDGSVPQNSKLDGTPFWGSLQLDEVAFPLILAYQLKRFDKKTWENHVKKAADFIVKNGPKTPQERWEEEGGYSPSTIAAEIAGLVCAAEIAKKNGDTESANLYLKTADEWQANIEKWTVTTNGKLSTSPYYVRITQNGTPNAGDKIELNNGAGTFDEREIVDAGFLELVRLGIKPPDDPIIQNSLKVIDENIRVQTPNGDAFYRYNHDGYGEMDDGRRWNFDGKYTGKGRLWALLSGERGQYEIALADYTYSRKRVDENGKSALPSSIALNLKAQSRLESMSKFANEGLMIPEQIWDSPDVPKNADKQFVPELKFGEGTGSATPLAWSMAQFIRLAVNLQEGRNLDTPDVVYNRYVLGVKSDVTKAVTISDPVQMPFDCAVAFSNRKNLDSFSSPVINDNSVSFLYTGQGTNIELVGDFTNWKSKDLKFKDVISFAAGKSSVIGKCLTYYFSPKARVEYKLIVDGKWILDPLNPNKIDNGVGGENSYFEMPDYKPTEWVKGDENISLPIQNLTIESKIYGKRDIQVYAPMVRFDRIPFDPSKPFGDSKVREFPVLYLQDGSDYLKRADVAKIFHNLVMAKKIKPFIIVFLDPKDRMKEYFASDDYAKFLATEVVPVIDAKYKTIKSRDGRAILGASLGGITSFHTAIKYPEIFGRVGGQSSSFWIDDERVVKEIEKLNASKNKFKFYIDDGTFEGVDDSQKVVKLLKDKGYDVTYNEAETGHNWTAWRDRLADAFIALWK